MATIPPLYGPGQTLTETVSIVEQVYAPALQTAFPTWFPPFSMLMPEPMLDGMINNLGIRLGWMRSHQCPCTLGTEIPGSPNPNCHTCSGRGIYWDNWTIPFNGLITYMHTSSAPDEPGASTNENTGSTKYGEPTLTIPYQGPGIEADVWANAAEFDAYAEIDVLTRRTSVLVMGESPVLPYQQQLAVQHVFIYDPITQATTPATPDQYLVKGGAVTLVGFPDGTAYSVEYNACPVYVSFRDAGGMPHVRPFGLGTGQIPRRFRLLDLDLWTRARGNGYDNNSNSPQGLP
jgi:hypothetical protein